MADERWINASFREGEIKGKIEGEIKLIQTLQVILGESLFETSDLQGKTLEELQALTVELRTRIAKRG